MKIPTSITGVSPLLEQLERERQEKIEREYLAATSPNPDTRAEMAAWHEHEADLNESSAITAHQQHRPADAAIYNQRVAMHRRFAATARGGA